MDGNEDHTANVDKMCYMYNAQHTQKYLVSYFLC
jgi:hypothetical protein